MKVVGDYLIADISVWKRYAHGISISDNRIVIDNNNSSYPPLWKNDVKNKVEKFVWSKEHGLIYYKFEDGEEFFLKDLLPDSINL